MGRRSKASGNHQGKTQGGAPIKSDIMRIIGYFPAYIRATFRLLDTKRRGPHAHQTHRPTTAIRPHPRIQPLQSPGPTLPHIQRRQTQTMRETRPTQTRSREPEHRRDDEHGREPAAPQNNRLAQHGAARPVPRPHADNRHGIVQRIHDAPLAQLDDRPHTTSLQFT